MVMLCPSAHPPGRAQPTLKKKPCNESTPSFIHFWPSNSRGKSVFTGDVTEGAPCGLFFHLIRQSEFQVCGRLQVCRCTECGCMRK